MFGTMKDLISSWIGVLDYVPSTMASPSLYWCCTSAVVMFVVLLAGHKIVLYHKVCTTCIVLIWGVHTFITLYTVAQISGYIKYDYDHLGGKSRSQVTIVETKLWMPCLQMNIVSQSALIIASILLSGFVRRSKDGPQNHNRL